MDGLTLTLGENPEGQPGKEDLEERGKVLAEKVQRDMRELVDILKSDLPKFVERAVKERFIAAPSFADAMSDADLKALKAAVVETGKKLVAEVATSLDELAIWVDAPGPIPASAERGELRPNAEVYRRLQRAGAFVRDLLAAHKFPDLREAEFQEAYRLPSWFIGGKYPKSVVQSYWRNLEEYQAVRDALVSMKDRDEKGRLASRWDAT